MIAAISRVELGTEFGSRCFPAKVQTLQNRVRGKERSPHEELVDHKSEGEEIRYAAVTRSPTSCSGAM